MEINSWTREGFALWLPYPLFIVTSRNLMRLSRLADFFLPSTILSRARLVKNEIPVWNILVHETIGRKVLDTKTNMLIT